MSEDLKAEVVFDDFPDTQEDQEEPEVGERLRTVLESRNCGKHANGNSQSAIRQNSHRISMNINKKNITTVVVALARIAFCLSGTSGEVPAAYETRSNRRPWIKLQLQYSFKIVETQAHVQSSPFGQP